ncbi:Cyclin-A2-1 [Durusdinium trenchii]|uniref:Cyclin-A2-1 n=1 Tax=Durusdinium trenchii TaxID=1381693 RepID=A0ABP0RJ47_9DINO
MPQVMDDITNIAGGGAKKQSRQKLEFEGKENQVPTAPIQKDLDSCGQGAADQASAPKQQQPAKHEVTTRRVVETGEPKSEKVWELMRDASRDLVECWAKSAKGTFHPWMQNSLAKLGRLAGPLGPRLQSGLQRGPPGMPPPPPPVPDWADLNILRPSATLHACHDPDLTALELQELTHDNLMLGHCHQQMEQLRPDAEEVHECLTAEERQRSLLWLSQVCTLHALDDCVFHDSVMLLDRYVAHSQDRSLLEDELCRFMALFGIARKVQGAAGGGSNYAPGYLTRNLGPEKFARVLAAELEVLKVGDDGGPYGFGLPGELRVLA